MSKSRTDPSTMDIYIRVSRVSGRKGESYRSPKQQEEAMRAWAERENVTIGLVVKEEDVSGKSKAKDRGLEKLLERAEAGVTDGIIVYRISRFGRRMRDTVASVGRLADAGRRLVSVDEGYDTSQASGQILLGVLAGIAEQQLEERTKNWETTVYEAVVEEGKHIACRAAIGYRRRDQTDPQYDGAKLIKDARLVVEPIEAKVIRKAYRLRAQGNSLSKIATNMSQALGRSFTKSAVSYILQNETYLGVARGPGGVRLDGAHEAIVSRELFDAAQARFNGGNPRDGSLSSQALLSGIITCASCGRRLNIQGRKDGKGQRKPFYVCTVNYRGGGKLCEAPANGDVALIDDYVLQLLVNDEGGALAGLSAGEESYVEARAALLRAEDELDKFQDPTLSTELGMDRWRRGLAIASERVREAKTRLWELQEYADLEDAPVVELDGRKVLYEVFGEDMEADRRTLRRAIGVLTLTKCDKRRRWQPIEARINLRWSDGREPQIPSVAELLSAAR